jgi:hypothetical protein
MNKKNSQMRKNHDKQKKHKQNPLLRFFPDFFFNSFFAKSTSRLRSSRPHVLSCRYLPVNFFQEKKMKLLCAFLVLAVVGLTAVMAVPSQPPPQPPHTGATGPANDEVGGAEYFSGYYGTLFGTLKGATAFNGEEEWISEQVYNFDGSSLPASWGPHTLWYKTVAYDGDAYFDDLYDYWAHQIDDIFVAVFSAKDGSVDPMSMKLDDLVMYGYTTLTGNGYWNAYGQGPVENTIQVVYLASKSPTTFGFSFDMDD